MAVATGDFHNNYETLKKELRSVKYPHPLNDEDVQNGLPIVYLPIMHYILLVYSPKVAEYITEKGFELYAKNDFRFMESAFKLLLNNFEYKPQFTIQQFFQNGFAERKIMFACNVIEMVKNKHLSLNKGNPVTIVS